MIYRNLGSSGLRVSCIGIGTWITFANQIDDQVAEDILKIAYENGINYFDTSETYAGGRAEILLGKLLNKLDWKRSTYVISTKIHAGGKYETEKGLSRKHIIEGVQNSLKRLQMDYVDIVFAKRYDKNLVTIEEIVRAFTFIINKGHAFYWGTTKWSPTEIMEAYSLARQFNLIPPITDQLEYNLMTREKFEISMQDMNHKIGLGLIIHSPLAGGILTGKYDDGIPTYSRASLITQNKFKEKLLSDQGREMQSKMISQLIFLATTLQSTAAQLSIAWCLRNNECSCVLMGVTSVEQLIENLKAINLLSIFTPKDDGIELREDMGEKLNIIFDNDPKIRIKSVNFDDS
ncbi:unnamed protein product [Gordionus sp. m RMFG-2023]|uniref:voltage-gated potassium channel subunit beta-3-like n=1 Tax=Gordionus sp. m RMFG-2023 TaxID=3053472 RepID=UPI0030DEE2C8